MIRVAVSQRITFFSERQEKRDELDQRLIVFLWQAGFIPIPVPNAIENYMDNTDKYAKDFSKWLKFVKPDAIVLSGGNNLHEFKERDITEKNLMDYAISKKLPLLGICRGMQMIANWAGVSLHPVQKHIKTRHKIFGKLSGVVNSYHAFSLEKCPQDFTVLAFSEDGEIEAIRHNYLPWEGWMWHPEREKNFSIRDITQIKSLFNSKKLKILKGK